MKKKLSNAHTQRAALCQLGGDVDLQVGIALLVVCYKACELGLERSLVAVQLANAEARARGLCQELKKKKGGRDKRMDGIYEWKREKKKANFVKRYI